MHTAPTATSPRLVLRRRPLRPSSARVGTRAAIVAAAARAFADRGYHRTSLHEIGEDVGIQKASIFHHFASKEALYRAVLEEGRGQGEAIVRAALSGGDAAAAENAVAAAGNAAAPARALSRTEKTDDSRSAEAGAPDWPARVRALLDAYVALVAAHPEQTKILLRQALGDAPEDYDASPDSDRLLELVTSFLEDGQRAGAFPSFDATSVVLGVMGMVVFFFTVAPVVAPGWSAALGDDRVEHLRRHVAAIVDRMLAFAPCAASADAFTPSDCRGARDG